MNISHSLNNHLVGIMADSHDNVPLIKLAVELFNDQGVGLTVHAGDIIAPFAAKECGALFSSFISVFGNNDGEKKGLSKVIKSFGSIFSSPYFFNWQEKRFALLHEQFDVDKLDETGEFDVIVYGHLHTTEIRRGKALIVNPGEAGGWLYGRSTVAVLDCKSMKAELIEL